MVRSIVRMAGAFAVIVSTGVLTEAAVAADDQSQSTQLEEVQVTGSRILRNQIEGPAPVTTITVEQIERQGFSTVADVLNSLVQTNSVAQNEQFTIGFTPNLNTVDLRGLGPGYTLVLVDGRRVPDYPGAVNGQSNAVNIGAIPVVAVERIEVLSASASAIYGSDAVAGVVNIILKKNYEGYFGSARYGTTTEGGGKSWRAQAGGGHRFLDNKLNTFLGFEYLKRDPIWAFERSRTDSNLDAPTPGGQVASRSRLLVDDFQQGDSLYIDPTPEVCANFADVGLQHNFRPDRGFYCGSTTFNSLTTLRNREENYSLLSHASFKINNLMEAYGFGSYWNSKSLSQFSAPYWFSGAETGEVVDATAEDVYGIGGQALTFQRLFQPGETGGIDDAATRYNEESFELGFGLQGNVWRDFHYDAHFSTSRYTSRNRTRYFVTDLVEDYFLGQPVGEAGGFLEGSGILTYEPNYEHFNNPLTPEIYQSLSAVSTDRNYTSIQMASAQLSGSLFSLPGGDAQFATVLEWERQKYQLSPDPGTLPATSTFWGITATGGEGKRDRYALGVEFRVPIIKQVVTSLAARYDNYNDITQVDDAVTYNAGIEIRPIKSLLIRGAYATSFRAPDMHYIFAGESGFFTTADDEYKCRKFEPEEAIEDCTYASSNFAGFRSGNQDLEEETGKSFTAGIVWDPLDRLSFSIDYYDIKLNDVVGDESITTLLRTEADCRLGQDTDGNPVDINSGDCQDTLSRIDRLPETGDENGETLLSVAIGPINQAVLHTTGIDATANYGLNAGRWGRFGFSLAWSHVLTYKFAAFAGDPVEDIRDTVDQANDLVGYRSRITSSITWDVDKWGFALFGSQFGSIPSERGNNRLRSYTRYNASIRYAINSHATVSLIGNNIFSEQPPYDAEEVNFPYYDVFHYDVYGRELFAQVDIKF